MSWFDEQIKFRKQKDNETFEKALEGIANAIIGDRLSQALNENELADDAIDEILRYYHYSPKEKSDPSSYENIDQLLESRLRPFGIMRRTVELPGGWYKDAIGPMIGTLRDGGSLVALIPNKYFGYTIYDFAHSQKIKLNKNTEQLLDTEAICFYKSLPQRKLTVKDLIVYMLESMSAHDLAMFVGTMGLTTLLGLLAPMFTKWLFGEVLESGNVKMLIGLACFMISYSLSEFLIRAFQALVFEKNGVKQNISMTAAVMSRILSLPPKFFREYAPGELYRRSQYINSLSSLIVNTMGTTTITAIFSLIYVGQISSFSPAMVGPSLLFSLISLVISVILVIMQIGVSRERMKEEAKTSGITYSMITGVQKIRLSGSEKRMFSRWANQYAKEAGLKYNPPFMIKLGNPLVAGVGLISTIVMYYIAIKSKTAVADYYAFNTAYAMVSATFSALITMASTAASIKPIMEMAKPILDAEPEIDENNKIVSSLRGSIELNNISFRYSDDMPYVIDDLSVKINPGEYVAIVGSTGCGKSTLVRLLLGFEKPERGAVLYDGNDLTHLDLKSVRQNIGTVMQDGKLFLGDIYSNITISAPGLSMDDAWEAARIASIDKDIEEMPMGMFTMIAEGQGGISGGQKQRLMIARAVAPKPKILIFDEATSALDNVTQKHVSEAIDGLKCTRIVIAHRLSTIRHCDRIIVLDKGKIIEEGSYQQLIDKDGFFAKLVERQKLDM